MKKHLVALIALPFLLSSAHAACPGGSTCETYSGQYSYTINGGVTARQDYNRWVDVWRSLADAGVDCTGVGDSTTALQNAINAAPDHSTLIAPVGCQIKITSTIDIIDRVDLNLMSLQRPINGVPGGPTIDWEGTGSGPWINIYNGTAINLQGFYFKTTKVNTFNTVINIDGTGGSGHQTATLNMVRDNSFMMQGQSNASLRVIAISVTSSLNNENYTIANNDILCSGSNAQLRAVDGVINNASTSLTSATAAFVAGDVGKRLRVSYATGILDTTVSSVTNSTTVVMAAAAASSQTGATVHIGTSYGSGIYINGSNAFHERLYDNRISLCAAAFDLVTSTYDIRHYGGGQNDIGIKNTNSSGTLEFYDAEHDVQGLTGLGQINIRTMRIVLDNAAANGWINSPGTASITIEGAQVEGAPAASNFVLFGGGGPNARFTSINNNYGAITFAQTNYCSYRNTTFINDIFSSIGAQSGYCGTTGLPTSASGLPSGAIWRNSNVLTVVP